MIGCTIKSKVEYSCPKFSLQYIFSSSIISYLDDFYFLSVTYRKGKQVIEISMFVNLFIVKLCYWKIHCEF